MAWPKGRPRKQPEAKPEPVDVIGLRRQVCALRVRQQPIPDELAMYDWLPLAKIAVIIRREMADACAPDSAVEGYVMKHVDGDLFAS